MLHLLELSRHLELEPQFGNFIALLTGLAKPCFVADTTYLGDRSISIEVNDSLKEIVPGSVGPKHIQE